MWRQRSVLYPTWAPIDRDYGYPFRDSERIRLANLPITIKLWRYPKCTSPCPARKTGQITIKLWAHQICSSICPPRQSAKSQLNCGDTKYVQVSAQLANPPNTIKLWGKKYVQRMAADLGNSPITIKLWNESVPDFAAWIVPA